ncbi:MAG: DUF2934 domain-containing protein [Solirubrobacterales bacterium]|nr:DUF2934 domain-containing protein [Solirubrobacterales bacterium]
MTETKAVLALTPDERAKRTTTKKAPPKKAPAKATAKKAPAKATAKRAPAKRDKMKAAPSHQAIARRAYELYEAEGGGDEVAHWLQAERELSAR